jgi:hypothetical protein
MPIYEKKEYPKPNHYYPKYGGWRFGQGNASVHSMAPPPFAFAFAKEKW